MIIFTIPFLCFLVLLRHLHEPLDLTMSIPFQIHKMPNLSIRRVLF